MSEMKKARDLFIIMQADTLPPCVMKSESEAQAAIDMIKRSNEPSILHVRTVLPADSNRKAQIEAARKDHDRREMQRQLHEHKQTGTMVFHEDDRFDAGAEWADANPVSSGSGEERLLDRKPERYKIQRLENEVSAKDAEIARLQERYDDCCRKYHRTGADWVKSQEALAALSSEPEPGEFEFIFDPHDTYLGMTEQQWDRLHECKVKVKAIRQEKSE